MPHDVVNGASGLTLEMVERALAVLSAQPTPQLSEACAYEFYQRYLLDHFFIPPPPIFGIDVDGKPMIPATIALLNHPLYVTDGISATQPVADK